MNSKWPKLMLISGITASPAVSTTRATATEAPAGRWARTRPPPRADWPVGSLAMPFRESDRTIPEAIATATGAENARDRHRRHRNPIRDPLRLQPVAGIFPDHDFDQLEPLGLVDRFRQQLLVPDVVVARFLLVHRTAPAHALQPPTRSVDQGL